MPREIFQVKDSFLYPSGIHVNNKDSSFHAVHYKPNPDRLEQMVEHEEMKEEEDEKYSKDSFEEFQ